MFTQANFGDVAGRFSAPGALRRSAIAPLWSSRRAQRIFSKTPLAFMRPKNALIQGFAHRAHQNPKRIMVTMRKQVQKITAVAARATSSAAC